MSSAPSCSRCPFCWRWPIGMGYLAWTLASLIVGPDAPFLVRPALAAFIMVVWDFAEDPIWSNFVGAWVWHDGGAYFGVPASNFFGWYLTVFLIFLWFARTLPPVSPAAKMPAWFWTTAAFLCRLRRRQPAGRLAGRHLPCGRRARHFLAGGRHPARLGSGLPARHGGIGFACGPANSPKTRSTCENYK